MDISKDKIASLLGNPEIMSMIAGLASGMSLPLNEKAETASVSDEKIPDADIEINEPVQIPFESLSKAAPANMPKDRRIALLEAIKPYVSTSKRTKVDGLVKAIGVAGILNNYTSAFFTGASGDSEDTGE